MGCEVCKQQTDRSDTEDGKPMLRGNFSTAQFVEETVGFLSKVKLFKRLPADQLPVLATGCKLRSFDKDKTIIKQGATGTEFYVIVSGKVSVNIDGKVVTSFVSGDYFGEMALLRDEPRTATIIAEEPVKTLMITREQFQRMGLNEKLDFQKRKAVNAGTDRKLETKPASPKNAADRQIITHALKSNAHLVEMMTLDASKIQLLCDVAWEQTVSAGENIIQQGSDGDYFYMVKDGSFEIFVSSEARGTGDAAHAHAERVGTVSRGGSFGELALLYLAPRAATVQAKEKSVVWVIDRDNFKKILVKTADDFAQVHVKYLDTKDVFKELKDDEKYEVAKALIERNFSANECIFEQGEAGTSFYILYEGEVAVVKDGKEVARLRGTSSKVEIFGEVALVNGENRQATIKALSDIKTLSMDKRSFDFLLGPLHEIQKRGKEGTSKAGTGKAFQMQADVESKQLQKKTAGHEKIHKKDLVRLGLLGCGGFGAVELVEHTKTKDTYALKALSKGHVVRSGMQKGVMSEKTIQYMCDSDFIIRLYETYSDEQSLYFLLELSLGGELYATYNKKGFHGSTKHARFYVAGTVYAFDHLHSKKIIYRDLKPENLLITQTGNIKLTDMGLAKVVVGKTFTVCGTPDYFAPELISSIGHTDSVDWWTLGILTFELMTGNPPFESAAPLQIYQKVKLGINKVQFPQTVKGACEHLVKQLCFPEPSLRLPMRKGGVENIYKHPWYEDFDWKKMWTHHLEVPYVPTVRSKKDIANFSARKEDMPPQMKYVDDGTGWDKDFATST